MITQLYYTDTMMKVGALHIVSAYAIDDLKQSWPQFQKRVNMELSLSLLHEGANYAEANRWDRHCVMVLTPHVWPDIRPGRQLEIRAHGCVVEVLPDLPIRRMENNNPFDYSPRPRAVQTPHGASGVTVVCDDVILLWLHRGEQ